MKHTIKQEDDRHFIEDGGDLVAEMTFSNAGDSALIIDSTYVRDANRGQGLGRILLDSVVDRARAEGKKIVPLCPFAKAMFEKDSRYSDISAV